MQKITVRRKEQATLAAHSSDIDAIRDMAKKFEVNQPSVVRFLVESSKLPVVKQLMEKHLREDAA